MKEALTGTGLAFLAGVGILSTVYVFMDKSGKFDHQKELRRLEIRQIELDIQLKEKQLEGLKLDMELDSLTKQKPKE